jgi:light-regulated signal transduction histidine kinase (bacteriophytochrome)
MAFQTTVSAEGDPQKVAQNTELEVSEFLLRACHDLRTAVRAIWSHADLLVRDCETSRVPGLDERLGSIVDGARKIDLLADGLAGYSIALQIQKGSFQVTPTGVLLRTVLSKLDKELRTNEAAVTYDALPRVSGDPDRLMEVFENLIHNALRHRGPAPPTVRITAERRADEWVFAVRDNGPGVAAPYLENIFQPFVRLNGKLSAGPGMGLAICRVIVERHGGRIWAESDAGTGATFFFTLPADSA